MKKLTILFAVIALVACTSKPAVEKNPDLKPLVKHLKVNIKQEAGEFFYRQSDKIMWEV